VVRVIRVAGGVRVIRIIGMIRNLGALRILWVIRVLRVIRAPPISRCCLLVRSVWRYSLVAEANSTAACRTDKGSRPSRQSRTVVGSGRRRASYRGV
jgi:hypothetical protein